MPDVSHSLSTSALAKRLGKTTKQMFSELEQLGWIARKAETWALTAKGEFEGGKYRESTKFGRYIIWPDSITKHKALVQPDANRMGIRELSKSLQLSTKMLERLLQELGWVKAGRKGWLLTAAGNSVGGCQREDSVSGIPFVLWPSELVENLVLSERLRSFDEGAQGDASLCCDGHKVDCNAERVIDNWLYFAGLMHAYKRRLPDEEELYADFYLPQHHLYIEYWGEGNIKQNLVLKMKKKETLLSMNANLIEINDEDIEHLEEVLPRLLLKYDIEI
ncbi:MULTISPECIES: hypothetical protein [unclassified Neptuniibacter]|uniref:hypothetical protein n=1 Tax=unclassified Neptuniibacter TaxID=2630693 RepID=UPI000C612250|nr:MULTISPECIES: hypothetical protein [unclassified Neptuniibacter]MAY40892.1 hypothetical protein [Oceanospirillaceae bacterium]|tara:strand:- start:22437 stop:23267 length:831 start_codon:yes stop_codon:yes gene_type:complete